jgi:nucleoside-triphosphatase THEP1
MTKSPELSEKWIKASIIGTIWAASEIVLGSFFHNLKIPFSSNILTAIGIIVLISTSYKWMEKGLFWRAGLICALMKTMSPSAVIFGPMIAIFAQAVLLEFFTRFLGKNVIGFVIGSMFAMTWNLFHKIMNFIIFYGFNIVNVYADLLKYAQKQLNTRVDLVWSPIVVLALIYCAMGVIAAVIGMRVGKRLQSQPIENRLSANIASDSFFRNKTLDFSYSISWLITDIVLIISAFILLNFGSWIWWSVGIVAIVVIWVLRYKRALKQLAKPRFWIYFALITMATAFVINKIQSKEFIDGLIVGVQMNFRAAIVILGFSVLGTELYNPKIRDFFLRTSFKQLPLALELSFESLPIMISTVPEFKELMKNPVSVIYGVISQIEYRLDEMKEKLSRKVIMVTGTIGQGKTTMIQKIVETLWEQDISVRGIYSPRIMENEQTSGYDVVDIESNTRVPFLRRSLEDEFARIGNYEIIPDGLEAGIHALANSVNAKSRLVVIDEVGKLELEDKGWSEKLTELMAVSTVLLLAVRDSFTEKVIQKWNIRDYTVFPVSENNHKEVTELIIRYIN